MIILIVLISTVLFALLVHYLNQEVEEVFDVMNRELLKDESALLVHRIGMYLNRPDDAATLLAHSLEEAPAASTTLVARELHHLMTVDFNKTEPLSRISFASASGRYTGFSYDRGHNQLHLISSEQDPHTGTPTGADHPQR